MTILDWPASLAPSASQWGLVTSSTDAASPFTGTGQTWELPGARWEAELTFRVLAGDRKRDLSGLLARLRGPVGRVALPDHGYTGKRGSAAGTITATGNAAAKTITLSGMTGAAPRLRAGDRLGIGGRMYEVCADVAGSSGDATVEIAPPLRAQAVAAPVILVAPTTVMRLADDGQNRLQHRVADIASATLRFVEALDL
jgi:hypothetical protein